MPVKLGARGIGRAHMRASVHHPVSRPCAAAQASKHRGLAYHGHANARLGEEFLVGRAVLDTEGAVLSDAAGVASVKPAVWLYLLGTQGEDGCQVGL